MVKTMTTSTMTVRTFLERVAKDYAEMNDAEMAEFAKGRIEALDKRNASRKSKPSKSQIANEPIKALIAEVLKAKADSENPMLASVLAEECEVSPQKITALVKQIDEVSVVDVKVKGKGTRKAYFIA